MASKVGGIGLYTSKPYTVMSENMLMDSNVLKAIIQNNINRYFYASSAHVYPKELQGTPDSPAIVEQQAYPAESELAYGWAKLISEKEIEYARVENPNLRVAIARYIGIYGENQDYNLDTGSCIPVFTNRAINYPEIPFRIWGTGKETRSYCFIDDAIDCTKLMIEKMEEQEIVGPYNVGKQERISIGDLAKAVVEVSKKDISIEYDLTKDTLIWGQWCDCSKAKEEIGFEAKTSLQEGLKRVYNDIRGRMK
jgi:nucleoside-diphosphate-sugar epimerase